MITGSSDLDDVLCRIRDCLAKRGEQGRLAPPCLEPVDFQERFKAVVGCDLPGSYFSFLQKFDGIVVQDIEFFGTRRRLLELTEEDDPGERIRVASIIDENLDFQRISSCSQNFVVVGRWESGRLVASRTGHHYATLDHLDQIDEELPSLGQLFRFTLGRVLSL